MAPVTIGRDGTRRDTPIGLCPVLSRYHPSVYGGTPRDKCPDMSRCVPQPGPGWRGAPGGPSDPQAEGSFYRLGSSLRSESKIKPKSSPRLPTGGDMSPSRSESRRRAHLQGPLPSRERTGNASAGSGGAGKSVGADRARGGLSVSSEHRGAEHRRGSHPQIFFRGAENQ